MVIVRFAPPVREKISKVKGAMFRGEVAKLGVVVHTVAMTEVVVSAYCEA